MGQLRPLEQPENKNQFTLLLEASTSSQTTFPWEESSSIAESAEPIIENGAGLNQADEAIWYLTVCMS